MSFYVRIFSIKSHVSNLSNFQHVIAHLIFLQRKSSERKYYLDFVAKFVKAVINASSLVILFCFFYGNKLYSLF